jgi:hypothetical protein
MKILGGTKSRGFLAEYLILITTWALVLLSGFRIRPIQDDYLVLNATSNGSLEEFLASIWESQGGNLFPYAINALLLAPSKDQLNFTGLTVFYFLTVVAVGFSSLFLISITLNVKIRRLRLLTTFTIFSISIVSFEGLFVPSFIGAFSFSLASLAHLWPVILMVLAFVIYRGKPSLSPLAFIIGLVVGNSNAGESFSALIFSLALVFHLIRQRQIKSKRFIFASTLTSGIFLGLLIMMTAPGFSNRANNSVGFPDSAEDFIQRFIKATVSFPADSLSHPGIYICFLLGFSVFPQLQGLIDINQLASRIRKLVFVYLVLITSLIGGGTLAYTSWHQAFGLSLLLAPLAFSFGFFIGFKFDKGNSQNFRGIFLIAVLIFSMILIRSGFTLSERAHVWDRNLLHNICEIQKDSLNNLKGAELRYPPLDLGIEDIETWPWMSTNYVAWVKGLKEYQTKVCG